MPSPLMPADSDKELHLKLLDLLDDATTQYKSMLELSIPTKIKVEAQNEYNLCIKNFIGLASRSYLSSLSKDGPGMTPQRYVTVCKHEYFKFWDFYNALETLLVLHYMPVQNQKGNDYLKTALLKIPEENKVKIKSSTEKAPPQSPRSPRAEVVTYEEEVQSPRKRGFSFSMFIHPEKKQDQGSSDKSAPESPRL